MSKHNDTVVTIFRLLIPLGIVIGCWTIIATYAFSSSTPMYTHVVIQGDAQTSDISKFRRSPYKDAQKLALAYDFLAQKYPILQNPMTSPKYPEDRYSYFLIEQTNNKYVWRNHYKAPLNKNVHRITMAFPKGSLPNDESEIVTVTVFENQAVGLIFIVHLAPTELMPGCPEHNLAWCETGCYRPGPNYVEILLNNDGTVTQRIGQTDPFPYPEPDTCLPLKQTESEKNQK